MLPLTLQSCSMLRLCPGNVLAAAGERFENLLLERAEATSAVQTLRQELGHTRQRLQGENMMAQLRGTPPAVRLNSSPDQQPLMPFGGAAQQTSMPAWHERLVVFSPGRPLWQACSPQAHGAP